MNASKVGYLILLATAMTGCGGSGNQAANENSRLLATGATRQAAAADYSTLVQQLYVAYFGRPADSAGLANFQAALNSANAPTNIQELVAAYATNASVRSLIDSFGTGNESKTLYSGDTTAFVTAVFNNILNRPPQAAGLAFWKNAIDSGALTRGNAALSIMSGALGNTTAQGLIDAALVNNKISIASNFTASITTDSQINGYKGSVAAATVRAMLATVTNTTDVSAFQTTITSTLSGISVTPGFFYEALSPALTSAAFVVQANTEGAKGYRYQGDRAFTGGTSSVYSRDGSTHATFTYEVLPMVTTAAAFVTQSNAEGEKGYKYFSDFYFVDGAYSIFVKDNSRNATFTYETLQPAFTSAAFVAQANTEGEKGYRYRGSYWFNDGTAAIYAKDSSQSGPYVYKTTAPVSVLTDFITALNTEGGNGYRYRADEVFNDGQVSIFIKDSGHSYTFSYEGLTPGGTASSFVDQANAKGAESKRFFNDLAFSGNGFQTYSIYVSLGNCTCDGIYFDAILNGD